MIDQTAIEAIQKALSAPTTFKNQVKILCKYPYHEVYNAIHKCANDRYIEIKGGDEYAMWQDTSLPSIEMERVLKNGSELLNELKAHHPEQNKSNVLSIQKSPIHRSILYRIAGEKPYKHIIETLQKGTDEGGIIEVYGYKAGVCSRGYRLSPKYHKRKKRIQKLSKPYNPWGEQNADEDSVHSDLVEILEWTQPYIILPSIEEVLKRATELSKAGKEMLSSYKGEKIMKQCVYAVDQGLPIDFYDEEKYRILDHDIDDFKRMLINGWRTPTASNCGRVYYDLAGMPKWIRKLVRIKKNPDDVEGEEIAEVDYQALHSNLVPCIFKSRIPKNEYDKYIREVAGDCHTKLAAHINATIADPSKHYSRRDMKVIGLSFWNKTQKQQEKSPIYPYLYSEFPQMMKAVASTKFSNPERTKTKVVKDKKTGIKTTKIISMAHAETSEILFKSESALMEENLRCLQDKGIPAIYCYDALWVGKSFEEEVKSIMNRTAEIWEIPTKVG